MRKASSYFHEKVNDVFAEAALFDYSPESIGLPLRELSFLLFEECFSGVDTLLKNTTKHAERNAM